MKMLRYSLAAAGIAALISGAVPNPACASDTAMQNPLRIEGSAGTIILAENKTKLKKVRLNNVILKGYDPVAYFNQGKAVMGNPSITSKYNGATYLFASGEDKAEFDRSPAKFEPQYGGYCAYSMSKSERHGIDPKAFHIYKGKLYVCETPEQMKKVSAAAAVPSAMMCSDLFARLYSETSRDAVRRVRKSRSGSVDRVGRVSLSLVFSGTLTWRN